VCVCVCVCVCVHVRKHVVVQWLRLRDVQRRGVVYSRGALMAPAGKCAK